MEKLEYITFPSLWVGLIGTKNVPFKTKYFLNHYIHSEWNNTFRGKFTTFSKYCLYIE